MYATRVDVVVLAWPERQDDAGAFAERGVPVLFLVEPGAEPPLEGSCLQDWIRLPADDRDVRARVSALERRAANHPASPRLDDYGELTYAGRRVFLSPTDERLARVLVAAFDETVSDSEILHAVWPDGGNPGKVRVHVSRLRKRVAELGLEITAIRNHGYRLHPDTAR